MHIDDGVGDAQDLQVLAVADRLWQRRGARVAQLPASRPARRLRGRCALYVRYAMCVIDMNTGA